MSMNGNSGERTTLQSLMGTAVVSALSLATNIAFGAAALGGLWLLASLVFGHYGDFMTLSHATRVAVLQNIDLATKLMTVGLAVGAVVSALAYFGEDAIGYMLLGGALLVGLGIPFGFQQFGGPDFAVTKSLALTKVYAGFTSGAFVPGLVGALLIAIDVVGRILKTIRERPTVKVEKMTFGTGAKQENGARPPRTSLLGKCWEGPFCRDFIRPHCPIFLKRQACWQQKSGCYCEEDIVAAAASRINGRSLPMASGSTGASRFGGATVSTNDYNAVSDTASAGFIAVGAPASADTFAGRGVAPAARPTPVYAAPRPAGLTPGQKRERCRNCVIYNEHQREKYQLLLPIVLVLTIAACGFAAMLAHNNMSVVITAIEGLVNKFSFLPGSGKAAIGDSASTVAWVFLGVGTIVVISKTLQFLEWCVFTIKI